MKKKALLKNACLYAFVNRCETFIIEHKDGKRTYCNLKALNYIANTLRENIKVLYSIERGRNESVSIFDMNNAKNGYYYYNVVDNEFFKK